jgi:plastocyanin
VRRLVAVAVALGLFSLAAPGASAATSPETFSDVIVGFTFVVGATSLNAPGQTVRIHTGDTMEWTNLDPVSHDVSFDALPQVLYLKSPGDKGSVTFDRAGYYTYRCAEHPNGPGMYGLVFVTD